jgi:hypothetical protein
VADLTLTSRDRTGPLSEAEILRLGRLLADARITTTVSYPEALRTVVVVLHGRGRPLAPKISSKVAEFLGDFEELVTDD